MWRMILAGVAIVAITIFGFSLMDISGGGEVGAVTQLTVPEVDTSLYTQAIDPWAWEFPRDHGAHPDFQTEWWYYTGNLQAESGERFGFQFTIFRRAITPEGVVSDSEWRTNQVYLAHFTISDLTGNTFYHDQRFSRGGAGLAGATADPDYRVWLEDWEISGLNADATLQQIQAETNTFSLDITLEQVKPPALQGDNGLSPKSGVVGNASYYYTLSRLITEGTITIDGESYAVSGHSWMDHEFSTSALGESAQGWDWFGLIFEDDHEMMIGQIRLDDGSKEPAFGGMLIYPDGSTQYLPSETFTITATDTWESPHTGAVYPSGWDIELDVDDTIYAFSVTPVIQDQELHDDTFQYWEGAVDVEGDFNGYGYAELTGYASTMQGRF